MPRPSRRTRSKKRVSRTLPGGNRALAYKRKLDKSSCCSYCGRPLTGFSKLSTVKPQRLSMSRKRVSRPHGGQMCHKCLRKHLKLAARGL